MLSVQAALLMMESEGCLSRSTRHYIALQTCLARDCPALAAVQETAFLVSGGSTSWLGARPAVPRVLARLTRLTRQLARPGCKLGPEQVRGLVEGSSGWTLAQTVHALGETLKSGKTTSNQDYFSD